MKFQHESTVNLYNMAKSSRVQNCHSEKFSGRGSFHKYYFPALYYFLSFSNSLYKNRKCLLATCMLAFVSFCTSLCYQPEYFFKLRIRHDTAQVTCFWFYILRNIRHISLGRHSALFTFVGSFLSGELDRLILAY